jgi:hypothetical protein
MEGWYRGSESTPPYTAGWPSSGFRVALVPEPGTGALLMIGLFGLARRHRQN